MLIIFPLPQGQAQTCTSGMSTPEMVLKGCMEGHPMQYDHIMLSMDGQVITDEREDISMALGLLMGLYLVKRLNKTLTFLEGVVLKWKDAGKRPVTVKRVYRIFRTFRTHLNTLNSLKKTTARLIVQCALYVDHSLTVATFI